MKKLIVTLLILTTGIVGAGTIKAWTNGEALTAADINTNFSHIHSLMVGGHGARLLNADVSASAAIANSKLAAYRFIPRTWATVLAANGGCGTAAGACTVTTAGSTTIAGVGTGQYAVTLGYTATNAAYGVVLSPTIAGFVTVSCIVNTLTTTTFLIYCENDANPPVGVDTGFTFAVYDND